MLERLKKAFNPLYSIIFVANIVNKIRCLSHSVQSLLFRGFSPFTDVFRDIFLVLRLMRFNCILIIQNIREHDSCMYTGTQP